LPRQFQCLNFAELALLAPISGLLVWLVPPHSVKAIAGYIKITLIVVKRKSGNYGVTPLALQLEGSVSRVG
jgi:hypothetical protein